MRFSIEQTFLTDSSGRPLNAPPVVAHHVIEADTVDAALLSFLDQQQANVLGTIQRHAGAQAIATAHQQGTVFTVHVEPGSGTFRRKRPTLDDTLNRRAAAEDGTRPQRRE